MGIQKTHSFAHQLVPIDELEEFVQGRKGGAGRKAEGVGISPQSHEGTMAKYGNNGQRTTYYRQG